MEPTDEDRFGAERREPVGQPLPEPVADDLGRSGRAVVRGTVHTVSQRSEAFGQGGSVQVVGFTLQRFAPDGRQLPAVSVELRALSIRGHVADGHEVEAVGRWQDGAVLADKVRNLTTGATMTARFRPGRVTLISAAVFGAFVLIVGGLFAAGVIAGGNAKDDFEQQVRDERSRRAGQVTVPDVVGSESIDAVRAVADAGLSPRTRIVEASAPTGTVVAVEPAAGTSVAAGTAVVISVSRGS